MFDRWGDDARATAREREDARPELGRGASSPERDDAHRDRDPREAFTRHLHLPRSAERERVADARERVYTLRRSEARSLATVGAFRVVPADRLRDAQDRPGNPRDSDLRHLREQGLVNTVRLPGRREPAVVLTERGRELLEANRTRDEGPRQAFYGGLKRAREVEHDAQVYDAYLRVSDRLVESGGRVERVLLDYELKRDYQRWLHERDRDGDGRPQRDRDEIETWARQHELPYFDGHVHFPDLRIEYERADGHREREDVEVVTLHYRGAHGAAAARSGFTCHRGISARIGGGGRAGRKGSGRHGGLAAEVVG